jgi:hypothetical protein
MTFLRNVDERMHIARAEKAGNFMNDHLASKSLRRLLVVTELAAYLRVRPRWVYEHIRGTSPDAIPHIKLGKYVRFNPDCPKFKAWLERHSVGSDVDNDERNS